MTDAPNPSAAKTEPVACPFCGSKASVCTVLRVMVRCDECGAEGPSYSMVTDGEALATERAIEAWNTRTHPQPSLSGLDREAVAKLVCREMGYDPDEHIKGGQATDFEDFGPRWKAARHGHWHGFTDYEDIADQIIKGILALAAPAEGYVLVPVEPTEAMVEAHYEAHARSKAVIATATQVWSAMIAACLPAAPTGETGA